MLIAALALTLMTASVQDAAVAGRVDPLSSEGAAVMAPICAAVELQETVLALLPQPSAAEVRDLIHEELAQRLLAEQMPQVRLSAQGPDAVLVGAAMLYLHKRLI